MLLLPDHLPFPTLELENQKEPQEINIQNYIQHKEDISHLIEADTACESSNYELNEGRPKRTHILAAYFKDYVNFFIKKSLK